MISLSGLFLSKIVCSFVKKNQKDFCFLSMSNDVCCFRKLALLLYDFSVSARVYVCVSAMIDRLLNEQVKSMTGVRDSPPGTSLLLWVS